MTSISRIDYDAGPIAHTMPLHKMATNRTEHPLLPDAVAKIFDADDQIDAVSVEYIVSKGGKVVDATVPIILWNVDSSRARPMHLDELSPEVIDCLEPAIFGHFSKNPSNFGLVPECLENRASHLLDPQTYSLQEPEEIHMKYLLGIFLRDVSFLMPSDLGNGLNDIILWKWTSEKDLARIMREVLGEAWYLPETSSHGRLEQIRRLKQQARILDLILEQQTGTELKTTLDPTMTL
jgi:hypothetical protein